MANEQAEVVEINPNSTENLTDAQMDQLALDAIAELESGEEKPVVKDAPIVDDAAKKASEESAAKAKEEADKKAAEESAAKIKADADIKAKEAVAADLKAKEEAAKAVSPEDDKVIQDYALKHDLTVAEAKIEVEKNKAILSRFKSPEDMARALRLIQSKADRLEAEKGKIEKEPVIQTPQDFEEKADVYIQTNRDKLLEGYRKAFPVKFESLPEEAILEEIKGNLRAGFNQAMQKQAGEMKQAAVAKREDILTGLKENFKDVPANMLDEVYPDVKAILNNTRDNQVLHESFDIKDLVYHALGSRVQKYVKEAEERGYRKAKEEAVVLGQVITTPKSNGSTPVTATPAGTLNADQKERALQMFDGQSMTDDQKYEAYADVYAKQLKENPKFIG